MAASPGGGATSEESAAASPEQTVAQFQSVLSAMAAQEGCATREAHIDAAVSELFDIPGIARKVLRRHWSDLEPGERRVFAEKLQALMALGFATNFKASAPTFEAPAVQRREGERAQVQSQLMRDDKPPVTFGYLLQARDGDWHIVNVVVNGVSELSLRSAQYGGVIEDGGFAALIERMNKQIRETRAGCE